MPKICYTSVKFSPSNLRVITAANTILEEYSLQGYVLTLRQLYYQFVGRGLMDDLGFRADASGSTNNPQSYKRLGSVLNDARVAGLIDWHHMEDRTRNLQQQPAWASPASIIEAVATQYRIDKWATQKYRPEVWIEKEALAGVFERVCNELQVPFFCCRGYTSQSEMWAASQRLKAHKKRGQKPLVIHFGDHDPSGMDMSRDIADRLTLFMGGVEFERLALNMPQVEELNPPPNPAKVTDSRFEEYRRQYGEESWELDALDPEALAVLVRQAIEAVRDERRWAVAVARETRERELLDTVSNRWEEITEEL